MNLNKSIFLLAITTLFVAGCAAIDRVYTDFDPEQDFKLYSTFSWTHEHPMIADGDRSISPFVETRVMRAVKNTLTNKGYRFVDTPGAGDFAVSFTVGARDKIIVQSNPAVYYSDWRWGYGYYGPEMATVDSYTEGSLAIDVYDTRRKSPVWHGTASKRLGRAELKGATEGIPPAVETIMADFPAKSAQSN